MVVKGTGESLIGVIGNLSRFHIIAVDTLVVSVVKGFGISQVVTGIKGVRCIQTTGGYIVRHVIEEMDEPTGVDFWMGNHDNKKMILSWISSGHTSNSRTRLFYE